MSVLEKLTEGIIRRDVSKEGAALLAKWEKTGLLEGISNDNQKNGMAVLLENQAKELLREASSMAAGDVEGFASVAFPIVRRVFGGLIANELVSVQPMSLPSGLIFFLDFTFTNERSNFDAGDSIYGGNVVGRQLTGGVDLAVDRANARTAAGQDGGAGGFYNLGTGYSSPTGSILLTDVADAVPSTMTAANNELSDGLTTAGGSVLPTAGVAVSALTVAQKKAIRFDPDVLEGTQTDLVALLAVALSPANMALINKGALPAIKVVEDDGDTDETFGGSNAHVIRRLTELGYRNSAGAIVAGSELTHISLYVVADTGATIASAGDATSLRLEIPLEDSFTGTGHVGSLQGQHVWGMEEASNTRAPNADVIPEIDIKVDSIAVTAVTKKLKAKWTPELGQDLNAYHNLDAEVELTGILSEQIALEIDREILGDLVRGAKAGTRYWSRAPGLFVDSNGAELGAAAAAPDFTGTVSEWYETLIETINDVSAQIHRKTLRGGANFVVCSPEVANILEFTSGFRASVTADSDRGDIGAVKTGSLSKKFDVMVDPYFPRNVLLVGRRGNSFLESGYVYAPYVPLQVTPTIFGTEDFVPRKGVMTRYAKKMVRPDMYGLVIVRGLLGEEGATS